MDDTTLTAPSRTVTLPEATIIDPTFQIDIENVTSVYSGKPGCMCGCNGTYKSASKHAKPGETVSDRSVATMVNKVNAMIAAGSPFWKHDTCIVVEREDGKRDYRIGLLGD